MVYGLRIDPSESPLPRCQVHTVSIHTRYPSFFFPKSSPTNPNWLTHSRSPDEIPKPILKVFSYLYSFFQTLFFLNFVFCFVLESAEDSYIPFMSIWDSKHSVSGPLSTVHFGSSAKVSVDIRTLFAPQVNIAPSLLININCPFLLSDLIATTCRVLLWNTSTQHYVMRNSPCLVV